MAYLQLGGQGGRFGEGVRNPAFGAFGARTAMLKPGMTKPSYLGGVAPQAQGGSTITSSGGVTPWGISQGYGTPGQTGNWSGSGMSPYEKYQAQKRARGGGSPGTPPTPGWLMKLRRDYSGAFAGGNGTGAGGIGGEIPGQREMPTFTPWEGQTWQEPDIQARGATDIEAVMAANAAKMKERLGGEMGDAARRFGQLGMMQSAGGLGSGYLGTLGESERGVRRDLGEIEARYGFEAAQQAAQLQQQREQAAAERQARAFEANQNRNFGAWQREGDFGWNKYGAGTDYDKWAFEQGMKQDLLNRQAEQDNINTMMMLFGG